MASNTSTFTLRLRTEGMDQAQAQSQAIRDNLQAAQGTSPGAGSTSSRRVASSAAARPTGAAGASAGAFSGQEVEDYNRARGAAGAAGGSARDFADQARGLGGLVRVYATVAANAFAAAAAFTALSDAMDTSNMVKGLDQLGAASGISLGSLSKELVKSTNGAISLREAMEATAKATSAGLSSSQVIELGKAATKASQALGLNLTDAVSRLSRGISKLEPELLDELGIYVKIDDAVEKYARTLGKTANSLTDYERRQAFATEALSQANKKFGEIELDTNPYTKLSASLKDIVQTSAEFINKFLGPVVKYLSESPVALGLAVAFVAKAVLQQALPALGQYRDSLKAATVDTAARAQQLIKMQDELAKSRDKSAYKGASSALKETEAMKARLEQMKATAQTFSKSAGADYSKKADVDPFAMTEAEVGKLEKRLELRAKVLDRTNSTEAAALRAHAQEVRSIYQEANKASEDAQEAVEARDNKFYSQLTITRKKSEKGLREANRASILEETNKTQSLEGAAAAWKKLNEELAKPKREISLGIDPDTGEQITAIVEKTKGLFGYVERGATRLRGGFGIAFQAVSDFAEAWGPKIAMVVGVATAAFEALDSWLSTNKKELQEFSQATESADNAVKLVGDTLDRISKQELGAALLPQNLEARAKAFVELSNTIEKTAESFEALNKTSSWWDNLVDSVKGLASRGRLDDLGKTLSKQINSALDAVSLDDRAGLEISLKSILDVAELDTTAIVQALKKAGTEGGALLAEQISKSVKTVSEKSVVDAAKLKEALSVLDNINKSYENLATSLKDSSPLASFASGLIQGSIDAQQALTNTNNSISYFRELLKDPKKLRLFDENSIRLAKDYQTEIDNAAKAIQTIELELKKAEKAFDQTFAEAQVNELGILIVPTIDEAKQNELREKIQEGLKAKAKLDLNVESIKGKLAGLLEQPLIKGMQIATQEFQKSMQKVQLDVMTSLVSRLTGPGKAEAEFEIQKQRIEIEKSSISAMYELTRAIEKSSITTKQIDTEKALRERGEKLGTAGGLQVKDTEYLRLESLAKEYTAGAEILDKGLKLTGDDFDKLRKVFPNVAKELISFFQTTMGTKGKLGQQEGQLKVGEIAKQFGMSEESFKIGQTRRKEEQELLNITKERESLLSNIYGIENTSLIISKQTASTAAEQKTQESARADISQRISTAEFVINKLNEQKIANGGKLDSIMQKSLDAAIQTKDEEQKQLQAFEQQTAAKNRLLKIQNEIEKISSQTAAEQKKLDFDKQRSDAAVELQQITLNAAKQEFDSLVSKGALSEEYAAERTAQFALEAQQIQYNKQLSDAGAQKRIQDLQAEEQYRKAIAANGNELDALIEWGAQTAKNNTLYQDRITNINAVNTQTSRGIEITRQQSLETAKQNEELKKQAELLGLFTGIADTLSQAFGKTGQVLSTFVNALGDSVKTQMEYTTEREKLLKIETDYQNKARAGDEITPADINQRAKAEKDLGKLTAKNARDEMVNNTKLVGSVKNMFKEKTAAHRIFGAFERAMHVYTLTMDVAKIASGWMVTSQKLAQDQVQTMSKAAPAAAGAAAETPGPIWTKLAAGLAAFAFVMSLAQGGKGTAAPAPGTSSADRQETQGTGMTWKDGKKVETGGGVFGDPEAKSDAIRKSLERIQENTVDGLSYDNRVVSLLTSIDRSIGKAAVGLFGIQGLRGGTAFGTAEGTQSGGGLLGTGFLASKTTKTITDSGLVIKGTFRQLAGQIDGAVVQLYEDVATTTKKWYGRTKTNINRQVTELPEALNYINEVFSYSTELFIELGADLGMGSNQIYAALDSLGAIDFEGSLRGLKGEEFENALQSIISNQLSTAASTVFSSIVGEFKQFGEDALETVIRVLDQSAKVTQALKNVGLVDLDEQLAGKTITETTKRFGGLIRRTITRPLTEAEIALEKIRITDSLVQLAGSLETFLEQNKFYSENFLTEAERLVPVQKAVTDELDRLGLGFVDTREEFKNVVSSIDLTVPAGRELYTSLMKLAPGFAEVYKETEKSLTVEEMRSKTLSQQLTILKLLGKSEEVLKITRAEEIAELSKYPKAQADILIANQKYIYALEDEQTLKDKLIKQRDKEKSAINNTINSLKTSINTLDTYRTALLGGDKSILTPLEKYQQSQSEFLKLQATAMGPAGTEVEKAAQADAVSKLPAAADKFLESSRTLFASSDRYTADFNSVLSTVDKTSASLTAQKSTAELQLDELNRTTSFLDSIEDNTLTTATLLTQYFAAQTATQTASQQATLTEPVKPEVKEVTDKAVVAEIFKTNVALEEMRKQFVLLRTEQQAQTGAIITSNAQVVNGNAATVAGAVTETQNFRYWYNRQVVNLP